ncbi:MAG: hypothetical protein AAB354_06815 [candidate division KSB1 bacterium]
MTNFFHRVFYPMAALCSALITPTWAQPGATRLQFENTQRLPGAVPRNDAAGECWAWRGANEIMLSTPASSRLKLSGEFLDHQLSAEGRALLAVEQLRAKPGEAGLVLRWCNAEGQPRGTHALAWHEDDPLPQMILNHSGTHTLMVEPASARVTLFDEAGQVVRENLLFADAPYANERPVFLAASAKHFYVLSQFAPSTSMQVHAPALICFSLAGEEQWRRELPLATSGYLALAPSGNWLVANTYEVRADRVNSAAAIFTANGRQQAAFSGVVRAVSFSTTEKVLFALDRRELRCVELASGKILWTSHLQNRAEMFVTSAALPEPWSCIALIGTSAFESGRFVFKNARLLGLDREGREQFAHALMEPLAQPRLVVAAGRQQVLLGAEGMLQSYQIITSAQRQRE